MSDVDTPPVVTPPVEATPPVADPDEAAAVEVSGAKMVPLAALQAARAEIKELKPLAEQVHQIRDQWQQAQPYVQFLKENPQFMQWQQEPPKPDAAADPGLVKIARLMDYVNQDGSLNLQRAADYREAMREEARGVTQAIVQPVQQQTHQSRAEANWAAAVRETLPNGQPIDPTILGQIWQQMPLDQLANPQVARVVTDQAMMMQMRKSPLKGAMPTPPTNPPLVTENVGSAPPRARATLSDLDRRIAAELGKSEADMMKLTDGFVKGRPTQLED